MLTLAAKVYATDSAELSQVVEALLSEAGTKFQAPDRDSAIAPLRDLAPHPAQAQDYWSFAGTLNCSDGREIGVHLVIARAGLRSPAATVDATGGWRPSEIFLARAEVTDVSGQRNRSAQLASRDAQGLSGSVSAPLRIWVEDWQLTGLANASSVRVHWPTEFGLIDLQVDLGKGRTLLPERGSEAGPLRSYALTRLPTVGHLVLDGTTFAVTGTLWLDRAWGQIPFRTGLMTVDRLQLQLDDGRDVSMTVLRRRSGTGVAVMQGTVVDKQGVTRTLDGSDIQIESAPQGTWNQGQNYPKAWHVVVKSLNLDLQVIAVSAQTNDDDGGLTRSALVHVAGDNVRGAGYAQLSGYSARP